MNPLAKQAADTSDLSGGEATGEQSACPASDAAKVSPEFRAEPSFTYLLTDNLVEANKEILRLRDELNAARQEGAGDWRPIESAPKDGSAFLVYIPQASWDASLKPTVTTMYWAPWENFASLYSERLGETEGDSGDWYPTHWRPLPPPPSSQEANHGG